MELAELSKIEIQDGPPKQTSRTVKPADRCVISYNFEQTHSNNYTHNLLIGMFNEPTKKVAKNVSQTYINPNRPKLVELVPQPKKVFRQQPSTITKVYDSNVSLKKYVNSNSGRKQASPNRTYYKNAQRSQNQDSRLNQQREAYFQKPNEDPTLEDQPFSKNNFRQRFNEAEERRKSPYKSKKKKADLRVRNNSIGQDKKEISSFKDSPSNSFKNDKVNFDPCFKENSSHTAQQIKHSPSFEEGISKKHQSIYSNQTSRQGKASEQQFSSHGKVSLYGKHLQSATKGVTDPDYQKVFEVGNNLKMATQNQQQSCRRNQNNLKTIKQAQVDRLGQSLQEGISQRKAQKQQSFEIKKSRKLIEDEQMRQIEQKIRREQPGDFKKGYFKILHNNPKQFLPFNAIMEPGINIKRNPKASNQAYKQNKVVGSNPAWQIPHRTGPVSTHKTQETANATKIQLLNMQGKSTKQSFYKQQRKNNHASIDKLEIEQKFLSHQKASDKHNYSTATLVHPTHSAFQSKNKQTNLKGTSLIQNSKQKLDSAEKKTQLHRLTGNSFNIKRKEQFQNKTTQMVVKTNKTQQDITQNNQIKGFKVPEDLKYQKGVSPSSKHRNQQNIKSVINIGISKKREGKNSNVINRQSLANGITQNNQNKPNHSNSTGKNDRNSITLHHKDDKSSRIGRQQQTSKKNGLYSKEQTDRTVKMNHAQAKSPHSRDSFGEQSSDEQNRVRKQKSTANSKAPSPTIPRQAKNKDRNFKDWRQAELQKARKDKRQLKQSRLSNSKTAKMSPSPQQQSKNSSRKSKQPQEIDLDADQQDKFGLLAQKNVTSQKRKSNKKNSQKNRPAKQSNFSQKGQLKQQIEQQAEQSSKTSHKNQQSFNSSLESQAVQEVQQLQEDKTEQSKNSKKDVSPYKHENSIIQAPVQAAQQIIVSADPFPPAEEKDKCDQVAVSSSPKKEGVQEIEHLIEENGSNISSINEEEPSLDQYIISKCQGNITESNNKEKDQLDTMKMSIVPDPNLQESNLEDLLKATEEVHTNQRQIQPILNNVQVQLGRGPENEEIKLENQLCQVGRAKKKQVKQSFVLYDEQKNNGVKQQDKVVEEKDKVVQQYDKVVEEKDNVNVNEEQDMAVALPPAKLQQSHHRQLSATNNHSPRVAVEIETDYQEQELDKIADIPELNKESYRSEEFFQCNIKQTSKMSDTNQTINFTKYQPIDKDANHYNRAPILSFLYEIPDQSSYFQSSNTPHLLLKKVKSALEINESIIDQAVDILLSIDSWIIQRVFEPFEDKEGKIGVWLYCHGTWKLFLQNKSNNFRTILKSAVFKAIIKVDEKQQVQNVLKLISGVRIMRLKSSKKKVFNELEYSLKKGHVIKAYTAKDSKWKGKIFQVAKVETTRQNENVLQIRQENDTYWVKQEKFKEIFQHFLLICTRHSHFWTYRDLQHKTAQKTVLTLTSHVPSHGSLTLFYPSNEPSSLLLYKQLDSKVLKYMGKIEEKPNHNGNLYFEFRLHGTYSLFLQTPASCCLAIESTSPLDIGLPQFVLRETLKNAECEYVQLNHTKSRGKQREGLKESSTLERLKQTFIRMVVKK